MAARGLALGSLVSAVAAAAHATHGHAPSMPLLVVTTAIVACACVPASRSRLTWARTFLVLAAGQFALHAWFAWFSLPHVGGVLPTQSVHHGPASTLLPARDFSVLIPSPGMALAHVLAAGLLAVVLLHADWLLSAAAAILGGSLRKPPSAFSLAFEDASASVGDSPQSAPSLVRLTHAVVRRGPPAYCV